ncbi:MAG: hypothetical protein AB7O81_19665 [Blastocatellales bacterium]
MKTPLHKQLTNFIKQHGKISYREMEQFCKDNGYYSYTGARRLQEVRQPAHGNYDPTIGTIEDRGVIRFYVYIPSQTQEMPPETTKQPETTTSTIKSRYEASIAPQPVYSTTAENIYQPGPITGANTKDWTPENLTVMDIYKLELERLNRPPKESELKRAIKFYEAQRQRH